MARRKRHNHSSAFKAKGVLAAMKREHRPAELAEQFGVHPNQIQNRKRRLVANAEDLFCTDAIKAGAQRAGGRKAPRQSRPTGDGKGLSIQFARGGPMRERRARIDENHALTKPRWCELPEVARATADYQPEPLGEEDSEGMRLIDEIHQQTPFYASRRIRDELEDRGHPISRKRVQPLMRQKRSQVLYPRRHTSQPEKGQKIHRYLLQRLTTNRPNYGWAAGTYSVSMGKRFMILVVIMDWHSRRMLSWRISDTPDTDLVVEAPQDA